MLNAIANVNAMLAAIVVVRFQKMPNRKTAAIGGTINQYRLEYIKQIQSFDTVYGNGDDHRNPVLHHCNHMPCTRMISFWLASDSEFLDIDIHREDGTQRIQGRADSADQCGGQYGSTNPTMPTGNKLVTIVM